MPPGSGRSPIHNLAVLTIAICLRQRRHFQPGGRACQAHGYPNRAHVQLWESRRLGAQRHLSRNYIDWASRAAPSKRWRRTPAHHELHRERDPKSLRAGTVLRPTSTFGVQGCTGPDLAKDEEPAR